MKFNIGDKVVWVDHSCEFIFEGTVTKVSLHKDPMERTVWVDKHHKPEDRIYEMYCWPAAAKEELLAVFAERKRLKEVYDNSMSLIYQLRNKYSEYR